MKINSLPTREFEKTLHEKGYSLVAGLDEVGRGPVAGPIVSAAVIFRHNYTPGIPEGFVKDSKKIAEKKRIKSELYIKAEALSVGIGVVDSVFVDNMGISEANKQAFIRAIANLGIQPDYLLIDGISTFDTPLPCQTIVKGDSKCYSIAAASIIAKVYRDNLMHELSKLYPQYGFERNKGYGTLEHMSAIRKYGLTRYHRASFLTSIESLSTSNL